MARDLAWPGEFGQGSIGSPSFRSCSLAESYHEAFLKHPSLILPSVPGGLQCSHLTRGGVILCGSRTSSRELKITIHLCTPSALELLPRPDGCANVVSRARQTGRAPPTWVPWLDVGLDSVRSGPSASGHFEPVRQQQLSILFGASHLSLSPCPVTRRTEVNGRLRFSFSRRFWRHSVFDRMRCTSIVKRGSVWRRVPF